MLFRSAKHQAPRASRLRRKILGLPVVGWLFVLGGTALAVVGFIVLLGTSGEISAQPGLNIEYVAVDPDQTMRVAGDTGTCEIVFNSPTDVGLGIGGATPGTACQFRVQVRNLGPADAVLDGFTLGSPGFEGIRATVAQCGLVVPGDGTPTSFNFTVWVDDIAPSQVLNFDPAVDGLLWATPQFSDQTGCEQT